MERQSGLDDRVMHIINEIKQAEAQVSERSLKTLGIRNKHLPLRKSMHLRLLTPYSVICCQKSGASHPDSSTGIELTELESKESGEDSRRTTGTDFTRKVGMKIWTYRK